MYGSGSFIHGDYVMSEKLVLIDGHSILNRAFYGVPDLTNSNGMHTNAIYGFLNILFKILEEEKPEYLVVAFDLKAPTFRHEIFKEYKGTRKPMPQELHMQVPVMKELLTAMGIKIMSKEGLEADDILGTLAKSAQAKGIQVSLVSGDRDLLQIADKNIKIRIPKTKGGKTEVEDYYPEDVKAAYGVTPIEFIDVKALQGDAADNIPGVPKIGAKTATDLISQYGSVEKIYEHIEEITKKSVKETLLANKELADLSKVLATINISADIDTDLEDARVGEFFTEKSYPVFKQLELKSYLKKFDNIVPKEEAISYKTVEDMMEVENCFADFSKEEKVAFFPIVKKEGRNSSLLATVFVKKDRQVYYMPVCGFMTEQYYIQKLTQLVKNTLVIGFNLKPQYAFFDVEDTLNFFDILIAAYLINPLKSDYEIVDVANEYLGQMLPDFKEKFGKESIEDLFEHKNEELVSYIAKQAVVCFESYDVLKKRLEDEGMLTLFETIEMPLSLVLYEMEKNGVIVQKEALNAYSTELKKQIDVLVTSIYEKAGMEFNINSPKQLGEVLFEKLEIPGGKKTKTGYSTAVDVLEKLQADYPIVSEILQYRTLAKLNSTYAEGLVGHIQDDNKIHTSFNQTITATGRISSTEPNLQNIPMRMEMGRLIRKVFVPEEGYVFTDADYSQIELRILAHLSKDEQLIEAYKMDEDIHRITASKVFNTPFEEVTDLQRRNAKAVNFGIVYGISSFGLSQDLSISPKEAAAYIKQYFATYPLVKEYLDNLVHSAKEKGYVTTMFGRKRPIPELSSSNFMQRAFGERIAMNSPIQGTAADIMKIAMILVYKKLKENKLKSKLILQIHDELVVETAKDEVDKVKEIVISCMKEAAQLAVSLEVDLHTGSNWYEAK